VAVRDRLTSAIRPRIGEATHQLLLANNELQLFFIGRRP
jgi:hypothetical protein